MEWGNLITGAVVIMVLRPVFVWARRAVLARLAVADLEPAGFSNRATCPWCGNGFLVALGIRAAECSACRRPLNLKIPGDNRRAVSAWRLFRRR